MKPRSVKVLLIMAMIASSITTDLYAYSKDSSKFIYKYEGNLLPSNEGTMPRWERIVGGGKYLEPLYCKVNNGILTIDTATTPGLSESTFYYLPGTTCEHLQSTDPNLHEFYTYGSTRNPWQPDRLKGYTVEMRFRVVSVVDDSKPYAFWLFAREGQADYLNNWQFYTNRITSLGNTVYSGDLSNQMHVFRVVRRPSTQPVPQTPEAVFDLYLDGSLIAGNTAGGIGEYHQLDLSFGDEAGGSGTDIKTEIDYLRFDLTGAYTPPGVGPDPDCGMDGFLAADVNKDCNIDFKDFAIIAKNWLFTTDPGASVYYDCVTPGNDAKCQ